MSAPFCFLEIKSRHFKKRIALFSMVELIDNLQKETREFGAYWNDSLSERPKIYKRR